jgi:hypothetical protein
MTDGTQLESGVFIRPSLAVSGFFNWNNDRPQVFLEKSEAF